MSLWLVAILIPIAAGIVVMAFAFIWHLSQRVLGIEKEHGPMYKWWLRHFGPKIPPEK